MISPICTEHGKIKALLEKTKHYDKDERYMATSDLKSELEKIQGQIDADLQHSIRDAILRQLDDGSVEVQNIAVSCLSALVLKFRKEVIYDISEKLGQLLVEGRPEMRDSYADGLRTIATSVDMDLGSDLSQRILGFLLKGVEGPKLDDLDGVHFCLDVLECLLNRFGTKMAKSHEKILHCFLPLLESDKPGLRKRGAVSLAALVKVLCDELFDFLMIDIFAKIEKATENDVLCNYIQTIGIVGRNGGVRVGKYLDKIVPELTQFCSDKGAGRKEETQQYRENCLQAFESLILECPSDIVPHIESLLDLALQFLSYDPNWEGTNDSLGEEDEEMADAGDWGDDGGDMDNGWGAGTDAEVVHEDDDEAWRVRRAAVKVVSAFIATVSSGMLYEKFDSLCEGLMQRFSDRDVDVKLDVFQTMRQLISTTVKRHVETVENGITSVVCDDIPQAGPLVRMPSLGELPLVRSISSANLLERHTATLVAFSVKQLREGDAATQGGAVSVLRELCIVRNGRMESWMADIFPLLCTILTDAHSAARPKAIDLIRMLLRTHNSAHLAPFLIPLAPALKAAVADHAASLTVEGLRCCKAAAKVARPDATLPVDSTLLDPMRQLYAASLSQMEISDVEQIVKTASISAVAEIIARLGDKNIADVPRALQIFVLRLGNNVTRLSALRALDTVAVSPLEVDISAVKAAALGKAVQFLRQSSQDVTHQTAMTLNALLSNSSGGLTKELLVEILGQVSEFIRDQDISLTHLILKVICTMLTNHPELDIPEAVVTKSFALLKSPLLQGSDALNSLQRLFTIFLRSSSPKLSFACLLDACLSCVGGPAAMSPESAAAVSACVASLTLATDDESQRSTVERFIAGVESKDEPTAVVSLLCLGEIGRHLDISSTAADKVVFNAFGSQSQELRSGAAQALGLLCLGDLGGCGVPSLLGRAHEFPARRFLLLCALKVVINEAIKAERNLSLQKHSEDIITLLQSHAASDDEGETAVVAECLGRMVAVDCGRAMAVIEQILGSESACARATIVASLRFALGGSSDEAVKGKMDKFLAALHDRDLDVQRQAFITLNEMLRHDVRLVSPFLHKNSSTDTDPPILQTVYAATRFRADLRREMDLGAIKVRKDLGLPLRRAAFQCMEVLLTCADHWLSFPSFISHLSNGITDPDNDIAAQTFVIFTRLAHSHKADLLNELSGPLVDTFLNAVKPRIKPAKGADAEAERARAVLRRAMEAVLAINGIPGCLALSKFQRFVAQVMKTEILAKIAAEIQAERKCCPSN
eukprot:326738_1